MDIAGQDQPHSDSDNSSETAPHTDRILLVNDDPAFLPSLTGQLRHSFELRTVDDTQAAVTEARDFQPDLVLINTRLNRLSGIDVLREMRIDEWTHDLPVILITDRDDESTQLEALGNGATDVILRSNAERVLVFRLRACLARERLRRSKLRSEQAARRSAEIERMRLADLFRQAPAFIAIVRGPEHVFEFVNERYLEIVGHRDLVGKPVREAIPEVADQGFFELLDRVYDTGEPFSGDELLVQLDRSGKGVLENQYLTFIYQPIREDGQVRGVFVHGVDVTTQVMARRETELLALELANREERFRRALEIDTVGVIYFDLGGAITDANNAFLRMIGYTREELKAGQLRWDELTPPEWMPASREAAERLSTMGETNPYEKEYFRKDGSRWWGLFAPRLLSGTECVEFVLDVTEWKRAENARTLALMREQELREVVETVNRVGQILTAELDLEKLIQTVTDAASLLTGAKFGTFLFNPDEESSTGPHPLLEPGLMPQNLPDFPLPYHSVLVRSAFSQKRIIRLDDVRSDRRFAAELEGVSTDLRSLRLLSYLAVPVVSRSGDILGGLFLGDPEPGKFSDRTEQLVSGLAAQAAIAIDNARLYETARSALAESELTAQELAAARDELSVQVTDMVQLYEHSMRLANPLELSDILEETLDTVLEVQGSRMGVLMLYDPRQRDLYNATSRGFSDEYLAMVDRVPLGVAACGTAVLERRRVSIEDVEREPIFSSYVAAARLAGYRAVDSTPLTTIGGEIVGTIACYFPTAHRPSEREIRLVELYARYAAEQIEHARLYQQAQQARRARDEFLASAAHDLRTPLTTVKGTFQFLRKLAERLDGPRNQQLTKGLTNVDDAITKMASQIDELLDLARMQMDQPLTIDRHAVDLVDLVKTIANDHDRRAKHHHIVLRADVSELIGQWDDIRIARVFDNLVGNAIKYSPAGGEISIVVTGDTIDGNRWAVVEVSDEGVGIPPEDVTRIFERFRRGTNVPTNIHGSGIGLSSAQHIVQQHGGRISVASREGQGSTFTVWLPLDVEHDRVK